ncbi:flagellin [Telmatospirillum siberiense]|uniref:Flagellin C-terminal domain-containing protein n=1 Tax=Telmatospirillum siberiense TaxID=382514 RepID=A0A2N3Q022_9PROT|nr:flagellin [Telmatospirillum siberiense]PKU26008.1 hypothetical protein CWS72_02365 [Telmatospirillum siberiense]
MTRVSTLQMNAVTVGSALGVQSQYSQAEIQESSGLIASDFAGLGGTSSNEMLNLENDIGQAQTWASNATSVGTRTQAMYSSLGNMVSTVTTLESKISAASSSADNSSLQAAVQELQKTLVAQMNSQVGGNYLFSGSSTSTAPVDLTNYQSSSYSGAGTNSRYSYYNGDSNVLSVRISDQQTVSYGVTANSAGFEEALRATQAVSDAAGGALDSSTLTATDPSASSSVTAGTIDINGASITVNAGDSLDTIASNINAASSATNPISAKIVYNGSSYALQVSSGSSSTDLTISDPTGLGLASTTYTTSFQATMKSALATANSAVTDLSNQQEAVAVKSSELSSAKTQLTTYVTYLQSSLSGVKDVDTAQAAAKVSQYQTQLQASYMAVAQISKVNLAQYL